MNPLKVFTTSAALLVFSIVQMPAQVLFSDGFETYAGGNSALDMNAAGPNASPNGGPGNPWWGPLPPNSHVVGTEGSVTPHSGLQMIRGNSAGSDFDQNYYNLAYRLNGGSAFSGNVALDWWFYDPLGSGGSSFQDYIALANYGNVPSGTDYPSGGAVSAVNQRLSLGASNPSGSDNTKYQARVVGATDGLAGAPTWFNTSVTRSVGWHEGRIALGSPAGAGTLVSFYIDDMINPVLVHNITTSSGVNVIEINDAFGPTTGYFDDVSVSRVPEPGAMALLLSGGLTWLGLRRRK